MENHGVAATTASWTHEESEAEQSSALPCQIEHDVFGLGTASRLECGSLHVSFNENESRAVTAGHCRVIPMLSLSPAEADAVEDVDRESDKSEPEDVDSEEETIGELLERHRATKAAAAAPAADEVEGLVEDVADDEIEQVERAPDTSEEREEREERELAAAAAAPAESGEMTNSQLHDASVERLRTEMDMWSLPSDGLDVVFFKELVSACTFCTVHRATTRFVPCYQYRATTLVALFYTWLLLSAGADFN